MVFWEEVFRRRLKPRVMTDTGVRPAEVRYLQGGSLVPKREDSDRS